VAPLFQYFPSNAGCSLSGSNHYLTYFKLHDISLCGTAGAAGAAAWVASRRRLVQTRIQMSESRIRRAGRGPTGAARQTQCERTQLELRSLKAEILGPSPSDSDCPGHCQGWHLPVARRPAGPGLCMSLCTFQFLIFDSPGPVTVPRPIQILCG
jgi:hypothetical protein